MAKRTTKKKQKTGSRNPAVLARKYTDQRIDVLIEPKEAGIDAGLLGSFHEWDGEYLMMTLMLDKIPADPKLTGLRIAPFIRDHLSEAGFGYIHEIGVAEGKQNKGYGSTLIEDFFEEASKKEISIVFTAADSRFGPWLGRFGFEVLASNVRQGVSLYVRNATKKKAETSA